MLSLLGGELEEPQRWNDLATLETPIRGETRTCVVLIDPEEGYLSCGMRGPGRMAEPEKIFRAIAERLAARCA